MDHQLQRAHFRGEIPTMTNTEQLKTITERISSQRELIDEMDISSQSAISYLRDMIAVKQTLENCTELGTHYLAENVDYRALGDDHSEVYFLVEMICCEQCCKVWHNWMSSENRGWMRRKEIYYSYGSLSVEPKILKVGQKIVKYKGRTLSESMDSDEMRVNSEWLD